jgi:hypothetical protein
MKKLIIAFALLLVPALAFARGGGPVGGGGFHGSIGGGSSFHSSGISSGGSTFHSSGSIGTGAYHSSYSSSEETSGSYSSGGTTHVYSSGSSGTDFWFWMWLINHNNDQQYKNDAVRPQEHFPYILILDKTAKDYMLVRYIGPDNKTEKVSSQEAAGLTWLKGEINY